MKILVFLHGTSIMHSTAAGKSREERVKQVRYQLFHPSSYLSIHNYASYIPIGNVVEKLKKWQEQGVEIAYLSSHRTAKDLEKDKIVLEKYAFPQGNIFYRQRGESYGDVVKRVTPDILIEDDCESIGGAEEMTITSVEPPMRQKIKSIVVKEFGGIDHLPNNITGLL